MNSEQVKVIEGLREEIKELKFDIKIHESIIEDYEDQEAYYNQEPEDNPNYNNSGIIAHLLKTTEEKAEDIIDMYDGTPLSVENAINRVLPTCDLHHN